MFSYLCSQISYLINLHKDLNLKLLGETENASIAGSGNNLPSYKLVIIRCVQEETVLALDV